MKAFERETVIAWTDEDEYASVETYSPRWQAFFRGQGYASEDGVHFKVLIEHLKVWPQHAYEEPTKESRATWRQIARDLHKSARMCLKIAERDE